MPQVKHLPMRRFRITAYSIQTALNRRSIGNAVDVIAKMDSGSIAVFCANDNIRRNGDVNYKYRQNDNFLYLTGCNEPNTTLILAPNGIHIDSVTIAKEILFVNEYTKSWSGNNIGLEGETCSWF